MRLLFVLFGPISRPAAFWRIVCRLILITVLTMLTQIGGVALWFAYGISAAISWHRPPRWLLSVGFFLAIYAVTSIALVPPLAAKFGRQPLPCFATDATPYRANSVLYCALNRHYARPAVADMLRDVSQQMAAVHPGSVVTYLDAGFPFGEGFPILPHLSHRHGTAVDVAYFYRRHGEPRSAGGAWFLGYWAFAPAGRDRACRQGGGPWRWHASWLQFLFDGVKIDRARTRDFVRLIARHSKTKCLFVEPYLEHELNLKSSKITFAGCHAARHDDHLHIEVR